MFVNLRHHLFSLLTSSLATVTISAGAAAAGFVEVG
jgi:hypothetical protein